MKCLTFEKYSEVGIKEKQLTKEIHRVPFANCLEVLVNFWKDVNTNSPNK